ncbi:AbrB/MazE/SpoVT family DNA-binding domain-containing protein [Pseudomonas cremoricolorata]|uniref:PbsX family transcriptional regulator n=1 Tax=Pseudomonas cremoricolorata TaxID=157783 RepID=A0A089WJL6_9PSED|nr:AbrB/MazE/SpoVT family DNA-binding domain-containing protein [Pseudomonas cremoricolorata]AIR89500.1 PbsX family transcriptional regulator [Pseudomonas cremoricolorata]
MQIKIQQWGNSAVIRLPAALLRQLHLDIGSTLSLDREGQSLVLKPIGSAPCYTLEGLISECDPDAPEPEDMAAWNNLHPVGREE